MGGLRVFFHLVRAPDVHILTCDARAAFSSLRRRRRSHSGDPLGTSAADATAQRLARALGVGPTGRMSNYGPKFNSPRRKSRSCTAAAVARSLRLVRLADLAATRLPKARVRSPRSRSRRLVATVDAADSRTAPTTARRLSSQHRVSSRILYMHTVIIWNPTSACSGVVARETSSA